MTDQIELNDVEKEAETLPPMPKAKKPKASTEKFKLSEEDRIEFENIFNLIAGDEKNISAQAIGKVMAKLGMHCSEEELNDMIEVVDKDGYGLVNKKHFMNLLTNKVKERSQEDDGVIYEKSFEMFGHNHDGKLSMADIRSIMLNIGEKVCDSEIEEMLASNNCSLDGNGITLRAFLQLIGV